MTESRKTGLLRLRHLSEVTEAVDEKMEWMRPRFERLAQTETRAVSSFNLFQTPETIADEMVSLLNLSGRVLEPSAGLGRIYRAIRYRSSLPVVLVEVSMDCCAELFRGISDDSDCRLIQDDFLRCDDERLGGLFTDIAMNPPFKNGTDIKHILHARNLLAKGGKLVSLCANGPKQHRHLRQIADDWKELPPKSFKESGTNVSVAMVTFCN